MKVQAIVAHPDDEVLGCGATLAKHARAGDEVRILILGTGAMARPDAEASDVIALRTSAQAAAKILGATVEVGTFPDQRFDTVARLDMIQWIETRVADYRPEVVYTHSRHDMNADHQITHSAVMTACRLLPGRSVRRVLCFGADAPTVYVDVADTWDCKLAALSCYMAEMRAYPHPRSFLAIDAASKVYGSSAGLLQAEAFTLIREVA